VNSKTFKGIAATKIKNELNLKIPKNRLINLTELAIPEKNVDKPKETTLRAMFLSIRGCDKYIQIFLYKITVLRAQLKKLTRKLTR
jgi:hypothetical protein